MRIEPARDQRLERLAGHRLNGRRIARETAGDKRLERRSDRSFRRERDQRLPAAPARFDSRRRLARSFAFGSSGLWIACLRLYLLPQAMDGRLGRIAAPGAGACSTAPPIAGSAANTD